MPVSRDQISSFELKFIWIKWVKIDKTCQGTKPKRLCIHDITRLKVPTYEGKGVYGCLVRLPKINVSSSHPLCFRVYSHMTKQFTRSLWVLSAVSGAHLAVKYEDWKRGEQMDGHSQMDEMNQWTDGRDGQM